MNNEQTTLDDVIDEILLEQETGRNWTAQSLNAWVSRFPQFTQPITNFWVMESVSSVCGEDDADGLTESGRAERLARSQKIASSVVKSQKMQKRKSF